MPIRVCVFDAYGTLFDVAAAARIAAQEPCAEGWAPRWATLSGQWRRKQLENTWLRAVADAHVDFWQVTQDALDWAIQSAGLAPLLDAVLSVEDVGVFKPHASVYTMVGTRFGLEPAEVAFVSSNGWDACAAAAFGFNTIWVNRDSAPMDRLHGQPAHVLTDLEALPALLAEC